MMFMACVPPSGVLWKHGPILGGPEPAASADRDAVSADPSSGLAHAHRPTPGAAHVHEQMPRGLRTALRPVHTGTNIGARYSPAFFVFTPKRFLLTMSRVNMQIHSLTLDGA